MKREFMLAAGTMLVVSALHGQITPEAHFGFKMGSDYKLAGWSEIVGYFQLLDDASDKITVISLGSSTEKNPFIMAVISSPENLKRLDEIKQASGKLSDSRGLTPEQARKLASEAKIIVLITCSLHASEVGAAQATPELAYNLVTDGTQETKNILDNVVFLLIPSFNPDGLNMVKSWYDQYVETEFEGSSMPWLYQLYTGHDNNRDSFMLTQVESRMVNRVLYHEWFPQIYLDMHQMGNNASRIFVPPFIDPLNPNTDPLIVWELGLLGHEMAMDLEVADRSGTGMSHDFSGWWEGGFLMTAWWHNTAGLLTEVASSRIATPVFQRRSELKGEGIGFPDHEKRTTFPNPWPGGWWRLRDIVEYDLIAAFSLLKSAARNRETFLYNRYLMGKRSVEAGTKETPFAFVIPSAQRDPGDSRKMIEILMEGGVEIHEALADFEADGIPYPEGSHVVLLSQPFRSYAKDMLEPQKYPDLREYKDGPPIPPYDVAGWTLSYQMGVTCVPVTVPFEASLKKVTGEKSPGTSFKIKNGILLRHEENASFIVTNRLLANGNKVYWLTEPAEVEGKKYGPGSLYIPKSDALSSVMDRCLKELDFSIIEVRKKPAGKALLLRLPRLGMYKPWMPSMHEGWSRWVLEQYGFSFRNIHNEELRAGRLGERYDVIYIPDIWAEGILKGYPRGNVPPRYAEGIGAEGMANLKRFVEEGGTLITMDSSSDLVIGDMGLPVANTLKNVEIKDFSGPGSILSMEYDVQHPVAYGMEASGMGFFANSPAFKVIPNFRTEARIIAKYPSKQILKSGYLLGESRIADKASIVEIPMEKGRVILIGFDAVNRAQFHATFKILFNSILYGASKEVTL